MTLNQDHTTPRVQGPHQVADRQIKTLVRNVHQHGDADQQMEPARQFRPVLQAPLDRRAARTGSEQLNEVPADVKAGYLRFRIDIEDRLAQAPVSATHIQDLLTAAAIDLFENNVPVPIVDVSVERLGKALEQNATQVGPQHSAAPFP